MAYVLLTLDNIDELKLALRRELPGVKSGHLTEALASGLGFQTHASLLASLKSVSVIRPNLKTMNFQHLVDRLLYFEYHGITPDFLLSSYRSLNLPDGIWREFRSGNRGANDEWFHECERRNIPMIFLEKRQKYIRLNWDCITLQIQDEGRVRGDKGSELVRAMLKLFQVAAKGAMGKPMFDGSSFTGHVDNLWPALAYELADEYFAMLYGPSSAQQ